MPNGTVGRTQWAGVAEISVDAGTGKIKVHNYWIVADPGLVIQPNNVHAQMESAVIFALRDGSLDLPLVWRTKEPHARRWALPGGPVLLDEGLGDAAGRTLANVCTRQPRTIHFLTGSWSPSTASRSTIPPPARSTSRIWTP